MIVQVCVIERHLAYSFEVHWWVPLLKFWLVQLQPQRRQCSNCIDSSGTGGQRMDFSIIFQKLCAVYFCSVQSVYSQDPKRKFFLAFERVPESNFHKWARFNKFLNISQYCCRLHTYEGRYLCVHTHRQTCVVFQISNTAFSREGWTLWHTFHQICENDYR